MNWILTNVHLPGHVYTAYLQMFNFLVMYILHKFILSVMYWLDTLNSSSSRPCGYLHKFILPYIYCILTNVHLSWSFIYCILTNVYLIRKVRIGYLHMFIFLAMYIQNSYTCSSYIWSCLYCTLTHVHIIWVMDILHTYTSYLKMYLLHT